MTSVGLGPRRHSLVQDLWLLLQEDDGLTVARLEKALSVLEVCQAPAVTAFARVRAALDAMQDSESGRALRHIFNVDQRQDSGLNKRRDEYVRNTGREPLSLLELERAALDELALRLLGEFYSTGNAGEPRSATSPYLISRVDIACIVRDRQHVETLQEWTVIPLADDVCEVQYSSRYSARLRNLQCKQAEVASLVSGSNGTSHVVRFASPLVRGEAFKFSFCEVIQRDECDQLPKGTDFRRRFNDPVLSYRVKLQFIGERPVSVWSFDCGEDKKVPGSPKRESLARRGPVTGAYGPFEFTDRCGGSICGVAWSWRDPRPTVLVAALGIFLVAALNWPAITRRLGIIDHTDVMTDVMAFGFFIVAVCAGAKLVYRYCGLRNRRLFRQDHHYGDLRQVPHDSARALQRSAAKVRNVDPAQLAIFSTAILKPRQLRQRVVETYELDRRSVKQHVTVEVQIPSDVLGLESTHDANGVQANGRPSTVFFPVLMPRKSGFVDGFSVFNHEGSRLPVLSYREYLQLAAAMLRTLLASAYGVQQGLGYPREVKDGELEALRLIMSRRTASGSAPDLTLNTKWYENLPTPHSQKAMDSAIALVNFLALHYAIVALVRPDENGRVLVSYEQICVPDLELSGRHRFAVMVGARPYELSMGIALAATAQSYHLQVNGSEEGLYLGAQRLNECKATLQQIARDEVIPPHCRFRRRLGQPHFHFYARFFPEPTIGERGDLERPQVRVKYYETPPGSLLRAAVSAIACALLVVIVGVISSRTPDPGTDAPAFLLAFPALVAAWLGFESPTRRLLEGTLAARLSLLLTVMTSISASGLFMAHKALAEINVDQRPVYDWWEVSSHFSFLWITDVSWIALAIGALANAVWMIYLYISRTAYFVYLSSRNQGSDLRQHG